MVEEFDLENKGKNNELVGGQNKDQDSILPAKITFDKLISPKRIVEELNKYIHGQDVAKKTLAMSFYQKANNYLQGKLDIVKSHTLLAGADNTGKETIVRTLANIQNVPFVKIDFYNYYGKDLTTFMITEIMKSIIDYNENDDLIFKENTPLSIIYFDGLDILGSNEFYKVNDSVNNFSKESYQREFSRLLEKDIVIAEDSEGNVITTGDMLFIGVGRFKRLEKIIEQDITGAYRPGFKIVASYPESKYFKKEEVFKFAKPKHFEEFGFLPKLYGDFPNMTYTSELKEEDFIKILKDKNSYLNRKIIEYKELYKKDIKFTKKGLITLAKKLLKNGSNAGGIKQLVDETFQPLIYEPPTNSEIIINKDHIETTIGEKSFRNAYKQYVKNR